MKEFEDGSLWLEVLLTQLEPDPTSHQKTLSEQVEKSYTLENQNKFMTDENMARLHLSIEISSE